ncbi:MULTISPECIES: hypothetical protein [Cohnella]|uniref:hypothetical protein n=1 Tax=Cohnella TaxID=329857 RepID=UPI0009BB5934|nr:MULTISPECIES: hypothetical protein [Cohnella]MBN2980316.1 hypothetical protein [Cohnella algarum]
MATTIGIFDREQQVMDAVERFRAAGRDEAQVRVIVKNAENSPLLSGGLTVPMEEAVGIRGEEERRDGVGAGYAEEDAGVPTAAFVGTLQGGGSSGNAAAFPVLGFLNWNRDEPGFDATLERMGIPADWADRCAEAIDEGKMLLVADGGSVERNDALFRQAGAADVLY